MATFILWLILFVLCWPLALFALVIFPVVWLFLLPFRLAFPLFAGVFGFVFGITRLTFSILMLPLRLARLGRRRGAPAPA
jgi:hypothetical protein